VGEIDKLRDLPAVHEVLERLFSALARFPRALVAAEIRRQAAGRSPGGDSGGKSGIVARLRRNPLYRALRLDKIIYQALPSWDLGL